ncbi:ribosomal protein S2, flavodoxin-like domain-containing protein [Epithele typhae]|uniref:ribosomal protein S2, flavodoxin-like domain-containing protein n=1 Tax=Epithele typhae TaxID=378194 RepID=UPI00200786B8|nr:ribosomal protein S2, flavodoxin-like domain-containing protein [Epithele typhae]KAH9946277.1 ribosomal protein S2, flavodoxin-like domain-containing protein [Epithele typhae]
MVSSISRSWASAAARCARPRRVPAPVTAQVRHHSFARVEEKPLETEADWTELQLKRAEFKVLTAPHPPPPRRAPRRHPVRAHRGRGPPRHAPPNMNPNFVPYAYGTRAGITIIDLDHTLPLLRRAAQVVRAVAANGGAILFVGTRPDLGPCVRLAAERMGSLGYSNGERWVPGTLTNPKQIFGEEVLETTKAKPDLVVFLNPLQNLHAIRECAMEQVPTIGIVDSDADPRIVMYPIPANDESTRTAELISGLLSVAGREGVALYEEQRTREAKQNSFKGPRGRRT